jgi:predicted O-linked N-acetylglucosamine transferase (SPINDLY family)
LKYKGLDGQHNRERVLSGFRKNGIDERRVAIEGRSPHAGMLERYRAVDIALDTVPFSGCVTTCEALWMGVPVVTIPGRTFAGRHSFSHLSNVGCAYSIAKDYDEYVSIAVSLAGDLDRLSSIRSGLRQQLESSSLCDGPRFVQAFCSLMHQVWASFVAKS